MATAALAATMAFSGIALADGLGDLESLLSEQIVTSASKQAEGASSAPALSTSLSGEDLQRYGIKTLAEAIDFLTIGAKTSENLNGGEIGARGLLLTGDKSSHFLVLVDGHAMNEPLRGSAWTGAGSGVPIEIIDHIEVIVGPGSVLYGSNAMFGLINVVTKRAKDYAGVHVYAQSSLATSYRAGAGYGKQFSLLGKEGEITLHAEYYRQAGPYMTFGPANTGVDSFTQNPGRSTREEVGTGIWGGTKSTHSPMAEVPTGMMRLKLGNLEINARGTRYTHAAPTGIGNYDDPDSKQTETRASLDIKYQHTLSTLADVSARAYGDYFKFQNDMIASRGILCPFTADGLPPTCNLLDKGTAKWLGLDLQLSLDWLRDARLVTMVGTDVRWRSMQSSHDKLNVDTGRSFISTSPIPGLDTSDVTIGGFLQQTWTPIPSMRFNGGLRVDHDSRFSTVLVKRLSGNMDAWKNGLVKLAYAEAFRAPSFDESGDSAAGRLAADVVNTQGAKDAVAESPTLNFGTPLKPETVRSIEASIQQKYGAHKFLAGVFWSRWNNLVQLRQLGADETRAAGRNGLAPVTPVGVLMTQYQNADTIDNYGVNVGIDGSFAYDSIQYGLTGTYAKTKFKVKDAASVTPAGTVEVLRHANIAPTLFGNARVAYIPGGVFPTVALAMQFMNERRPDQYLRLADGSVMEPMAPAQVEGRLTLSGAVPKLSFLSYRLSANYALSDRGPYAVGPVMAVQSSAIAQFEQTPPRLIPVDRLRVTLKLQMDF